jgi:alkylation response protein AidB-like acyl-CoA dehydrogenase
LNDKADIHMNFDYTETQGQIRAAVKDRCKGFGPEYWRQCAQDGAYPEAFVDAMAKAGWLAALIPEEYGGAGLPPFWLISCRIRQASSSGSPAPPYSSGISAASQPALAIASTNASG